MRLVVDASVVAAALIDDGPIGRWCEDELRRGEALVGPHLLPVETTAVLRSAVARGVLSAVEARLALDQLLRVPVELWPFALFAERAWELRDNLTASDGWYVALAERLGAPRATLDHRLRRASGPRCQFSGPA